MRALTIFVNRFTRAYCVPLERYCTRQRSGLRPLYEPAIERTVFVQRQLASLGDCLLRARSVTSNYEGQLFENGFLIPEAGHDF